MKVAQNHRAQYFQNQNRSFVIAHRGASGYLPENTLEAFYLAISFDSDFIEFDLVLTKDSHLIVAHDCFLTRLTNVENFPEFADRKKTRIIDGQERNDFFADDFTLDELKQLRIRSQNQRGQIFNEKLQIPTFDELLELMIHQNDQRIKQNKKLVGLVVEVKHGQMYRELYGETFQIGEKVLQNIQKYGLNDLDYSSQKCPLVLESFDQKTVQYFARYAEQFPRCQLVNQMYNYPVEEIIQYAHAVGPCIDLVLQNKEEMIQTDLVEQAKQVNLKVFVYTFKDDQLSFGNSFQEMYKFASQVMKLDGIFTDFPDHAVLTTVHFN